jgi:RNA polymerase sigma-70 factor, ECF subfamily
MSERRLIERLLKGERSAFDAFFNDYHPKLYRFALRRLNGRRDVAEDVAQATICEALTSLSSFRGEAALMSWLCTICRRQISARCGREPIPESDLLIREESPEIRAALESMLAVQAEDPSHVAQLEQLRTAVVAALDYLPSAHAQVLRWKYIQELSVDEIASRLGRSSKAAESLLTRARESFREAFSALGADPSFTTTAIE